MKQKIKDFFGEMTKTQRFLFETLCVMIFMNIVYGLVYWILGIREQSSFVTAWVTFILILFFSRSSFYFFVFLFGVVWLFNEISFDTNPLICVVFLTIFTFFLMVASLFCVDKSGVKYWKVLLILLLESVLLIFIHSGNIALSEINLFTYVYFILALCVLGISHLPVPEYEKREIGSPYRSFRERVYRDLLYKKIYEFFRGTDYLIEKVNLKLEDKEESGVQKNRCRHVEII